MASFIIEPIITKLTGYLASEIEKEVLQINFPDKYEWLQAELRRMQCFLKDSGVERDHLQAHRIGEVRKLAYGAEDLITKFLLESESKSDDTVTINVLSQWSSKRRIIKEVEAIKNKLLQINQSNNQSSFLNANRASLNRVPSFVQIQISDILGLENETNELLKQLTDQQMHRSVLSIVGMAGIGKSTLAWKLLNHPVIEHTFPLRAWVTTKRQLEYRDMQVKISLSEGQQQQEGRGWTTVEMNKLCQSLGNNRYLVVLDDVWGPPYQSLWDGGLLEAFPDIQNGSRIMVTTQRNDVAAYAGTHSTPAMSMKHLDDQQSWELFCKKASISINNRTLQDVGKKIVKRCGGLPLSIVTLGGKFVGVTKKMDWEKAYKEMEDSTLPSEVLENLEPSYNGLTPELQDCFLRLAFFPVDHTVQAKKLTQIWIAEGLITEQAEGMEATAESYLDMLVERNMLQPVKISADGKIKACRIDNSLQELCIMKAKEVIFLDVHKNDKFQPSSYSRHRAIHASMDKSFDSQDPTSPLRTLMFFVPNGKISLPQLEFICKKFKLLKVLHLEGMIVAQLPDQVGNLQNLRYLNLRNTSIDKLQPSMGNLKKLLTLDIRDNMYVTDLDVIKDMKKLQNLYLPGYYEGLILDGLSELRILKWVRLETVESLESLAKLTTLKILRVQLEGQLSLDDFLDSAKELNKLESLYFYPNSEISSLGTGKFQSLTSLTKLYIKGGVRELPSHEDFPPNLMHLTLDGSGLIPFPIDELAKLPKLSILRLRNLYIKDEKLRFAADGFPRLKYLELLHLWNLKGLKIQGEGALRRLRHLKISNCTALNSLPKRMQHLTKLSELHIDKMRDTFVKKIQEEVEYRDRIKHVHSIKYTNTL